MFDRRFLARLDRLKRSSFAPACLALDLAEGPRRDEGITPDEVKELLTQGKSPLIENFVSERGNKFAAHLVLSAKKDKAEFEFLPR